MSPDTFERIEKKYLLEPWQHRLVLNGLAGRLAPDEFGRSTVTSVYFDTADYRLIERSLDKPLYKEKLRLRLYGDATAAHAGTPCFMEQKTKFQGVVYKRRAQLSLAAAWDFAHGRPWQDACRAHPLVGEAPAEVPGGACGEALGGVRNEEPGEACGGATGEAHAEAHGIIPRGKESQILEELAAMLKRHGALTPSITTACERTAWAPLDTESALRITFDEDIRWKQLREEGAGGNGGAGHASLAGGAGLAGKPDRTCGAGRTCATWADAIEPDERWLRATDTGAVLMEIKNGGPYPRWLCQLLSQAQAYPRSFSKYGTAYTQLKRGPQHTTSA